MKFKIVNLKLKGLFIVFYFKKIFAKCKRSDKMLIKPFQNKWKMKTGR